MFVRLVMLILKDDDIIGSKELNKLGQRLYSEIDDKRKQKLEDEQWKREECLSYDSRAASSFISDSSRPLNSRCKSNIFMSLDKKECIETDLRDFAAREESLVLKLPDSDLATVQSFPREDNAIHLTVIADAKDMRLEMEFLRSNTFPKISQHCQSRNLELLITVPTFNEDVCKYIYRETDVDSLDRDQREHNIYLVLVSSEFVGDLYQIPSKLQSQIVQEISEGMKQKLKSLKMVSILLPEELKILQAEAEVLREESPSPEENFSTSYTSNRQKCLNDFDKRIQIIEEKIAENESEIEYCNNKLLHKWYEHDVKTDCYHLKNLTELYPDLLQFEDYERREIVLDTISKEVIKIREFIYQFLKEIPQEFSSVETLINELLACEAKNASKIILVARHHIYDFEGEFDSNEIQKSQFLAQGAESIHGKIKSKWRSRADGLLRRLSKLVPHENQISTVILRNYPDIEFNLLSSNFCPINPTLSEHALYLERIQNHISAIIIEKVNSICSTKEKKTVTEEEQHLCYAFQKSQQFIAKRSLLEIIISKLTNSEKISRFLWVKGLPCMGKTTLISKLSVEIRERFPDFQQILRIANATNESESLTQVLQSIIHQITGKIPVKSLSFEELTEVFRDLCGLISKRFLIIIDGLENFKEVQQNPVLAYRWLENLDHASNVFLVMTSENSKPRSLPFFEEVQITPFGRSEAGICFSEWKKNLRVLCALEKDLDTYVESTLEMVKQNDHKCDALSLRILLYTCVANEGIALVARKLEMYQNAEKSIATFFARMERELGQKKAHAILGSMAASRHGLTYNELVTLSSLSLKYFNRKPSSQTSENADENSVVLKLIKNSFNCFPDLYNLKKIDSMVTENDVDFAFKFYFNCCDLVSPKFFQGAKVLSFANKTCSQFARKRYVSGSPGKQITRIATLLLSNSKFLPMKLKRNIIELGHFASQTDLLVYLEKCLFNETWIKNCQENSLSLFQLITNILFHLNQCFKDSGLYEGMENNESTPQYLKIVMDDPYLRTFMLILTTYGSQLAENSDLLIPVLRLTLRDNLKNIEPPKKPSKIREIFQSMIERVEFESRFKLIECAPLPLCSDAEYMIRLYDNALSEHTLIRNSSYEALLELKPLVKALCFDQSGKRYFCSFERTLELRELQTRKIVWRKRLQERLAQIRTLSPETLLVETENSKALWVLNWRKETVFVLDNGDLKKTIKNEFVFDFIGQTVLSIRQKSMKFRVWSLKPTPRLIFESLNLRPKLREKVLDLYQPTNLLLEEEPTGKKLMSSKIRDILSKEVLLSALEPMTFALALKDTCLLWLVTINPQTDEELSFNRIELPSSTSILQVKLTLKRIYIAARMTSQKEKTSFKDLKTTGCIILSGRENKFKELTIFEGTQDIFKSSLRLFTNQAETTLLCCAVRKDNEEVLNEFSTWNLESGDFRMIPNSVIDPEQPSNSKNFMLAPIALSVFDLSNMVYSHNDKIRILNPIKFAKPISNQAEKKNRFLSRECSIVFQNYFLTLTEGNGELSIWDPDEPEEPIFSYNPHCATLRWDEEQYWSRKDLILLRGSKIVVLGNLDYSDVVPTCKHVYQKMKILHVERNDEGFSVKMDRNFRDVFIVRSQSHEYFISEERYLVGLSENRSHFAGWSLKSGQLQWRMKPSSLSDYWLKWNEAHLSNLEKQTNSKVMGREITKSEILVDGGKYDYLASSDESVAETTSSNYLEFMTENETMQNSEAMKINRFLLSFSNEVLVASFSCPYLCVFSTKAKTHLLTLEGAGNSEIILDLSLASLSRDGHTLAHACYDAGKFCILLWNLSENSHKRLELENEIVDLLVTDHSNLFVYHGYTLGIYSYSLNDKWTGLGDLIPNTEKKLSEIGRKDTKKFLDLGYNALCFLHGDKANRIGFWTINDNKRLLGHFINDQPVERVIFSESSDKYLIITKQNHKPCFVALLD